MTKEKFVVIGQHFYQPPRHASHELLAGISSAADGIDWTGRIADECYFPQLELGILDKTAFDMYGVLRSQLNLSQEQLTQLELAMRERGVGDPFLHPILPDLSSRDRMVLIAAGRNEFYRDCGKWPDWFWPPETALDTATLRDIKKMRYKGVLCAPEQIVRQDGYPADNEVVKVELGSGDFILAFPFDRPVSQSLAFHKKTNADDFAREIILPRLDTFPSSSSLLAWTDGETFGHHDRQGHLFLKYLLSTSLPGFNVHPVSLEMALQQLNLDNIPQARLVERTAWSCPHGNLVRWNGECGCGEGNDTSWKRPFIQLLREVNSSIDDIIDRELPGWDKMLSDNFNYYFSGEFILSASPKDYLLMAKASSLAGLTSCATFFSNVHTSGRINILFVLQACQSLISAGLVKEGETVRTNFYQALANIYDSEGKPFSSITDEFNRQ